jgi:cytochrome c5
MRITFFAVSALALFAICANVSGQSQSQAPAPPPAKKHAAAAKATTSDQDQKEGERRFFANCGRCHNPPESISPIEVNAVLRHMRVRAMLSAEDEELIRKYLAP